jgi:phage/plasmid-like protein (TIGR03299 family)
MSAEVEQMFSVRENAWHDPEGVFTVPDYPEDWPAFRRLAGLEWEPVVVPAYVQRVTTSEHPDELPTVSYDEAPDTRLVQRSDSGLVLGHVGKGWTPVLNRQLGEFVEAVLDQPNTRIRTGGCLTEGRNVWCLVELDEPFTLGRDDSPVPPYLAVLNGHDGSSAFR